MKVNFWNLFQVFLDVLAVAGFVFIWIRLNKPAKDDPRFSRSMQILQSKISILEDLSDRTETQVKQLNALMENKVQEVQKILARCETEIQKIEMARQKSLEVAKIFQDKIPHQEIIERQNTIKFVKAAVMAHEGKSAEEIQQEIPLSSGEIDFIIKVNKDQLQFSLDDLPDWVKDEVSEVDSRLSEIGEKFRSVLPQSPASSPLQSQQQSPQPVQSQFQPQTQLQSQVIFPNRPAMATAATTATMATSATAGTNSVPAAPTVAPAAGPIVRKVVFPVIDA